VDSAERLFARTEERHGTEIATMVRARFSGDPTLDLELFRVTMEVTNEHFAETGMGGMLEQSIEHNLEREEAGQEPLPDLGIALAPQEANELAERIVDRLVAITRGLHPPPLTSEQLDELAARAYREITGRDPRDDTT
jgi:hypothetical protein